MSHLYPGKIIKKAKLKDGRDILIRHLTEDDAEAMCEFINILSMEDTFITFSGEQLSIEEEKEYVASVINGMQDQNMMHVLAFCEDKLVGGSSMNRDLSGRKRSSHVGIFGITIARDFRGIGLGEILARAIIDEARATLPGLRIITMSVYEPNKVAQGLYKKIGFTEFGRIPKGVLFHGQYVDKLEMYLSIS